MLSQIRTLSCPTALRPLPYSPVARAPLSSPDSCLRLAKALRLELGQFSIKECIDGSGFLLEPVVAIDEESVETAPQPDPNQLVFLFGPMGTVRSQPRAPVRRDGNKQAVMRSMMAQAWCTTEDVMDATGWKRTSVRATIARTKKRIAAARDGRILEVRYIGKETSYRITSLRDCDRSLPS